MNKFVKLAQEYVSSSGAHEASAMGILIFYEALKTAVASGDLHEECLTEEGLVKMFTRAVKGDGVVPSIFETAGIPLTQAH